MATEHHPINPIAVMGTLKRFYRNVFQNRLSFISGTNEDRVHTLEFESHLATVTYGNFTLTDAIRPSLDLKIIPEQGYKYEKHEQPTNDVVVLDRIRSSRSMPVLVASISLEYLFETFVDLLRPLGETVHAVLETSHCHSGARRTRLRRESIDLPVLKSFLYNHEDLLLHDGCTGISVIAPRVRAEVHFDEHKLISVRAKSLLPFEKILSRHGIPLNPTMELLTEAEHVHITLDDHFKQLKTLQVLLGMDESYSTAP